MSIEEIKYKSNRETEYRAMTCNKAFGIVATISSINNRIPQFEPYQATDIGPTGYRALALIESELRRRYPRTGRNIPKQLKDEIQRVREAVFLGQIDPVAYHQSLLEGGVKNG